MPFSTTRSLFLTLAATAMVSSSVSAMPCDAPPTAEYLVTFDATWSAETHPQDFPSNAHFSRLIGGSHNDAVRFWQLGEIATDGIEQMAETGNTDLLTGEVNEAIANGTAGEVITGPGTGSPGRARTTFTVTQDFPLATVVTMIAPSPDWFVGVSGLSLFEDGQWVDRIVIDLYPYDAGTDSGETYTSPNDDTNPRDPISEITGYPFLNDGEVLPLGTFTFERINAPCLDLCVENLVAGEEVTVSVGGGVPGEDVVVLWGLQNGNGSFEGFGWCVDFGFDVPFNMVDSRIVARGVFDETGQYSETRLVPVGLSGQRIRLQAAMGNTCPESCMSNLIDTVIE